MDQGQRQPRKADNLTRRQLVRDGTMASKDAYVGEIRRRPRSYK